MAFAIVSAASYSVANAQVSSNRVSSTFKYKKHYSKYDIESNCRSMRFLLVPVRAVNPWHLWPKGREQIVNCVCYYHTVVS